jgi:predicted phosphodiesterase
MIIHLLNDIHLEFADLPAPSGAAADADLHLLAGDIGVGAQGLMWALQKLNGPTAYVFGNHEHYGNSPISTSISRARQACLGSHVSVLEMNEMLLIPGARILGATLWTDFQLFDQPQRNQEAIEHAQFKMSDYRQICVGFKPGCDEQGRSIGSDPATPPTEFELMANRIALSPQATMDMHKESLNWLRSKLREPYHGKTIVLSHHAPHPRSLLHQEPGPLIDAAYASNLQDMLIEEKVDLWAHGHTHVPCDYRIGKTRIVSNPRGYFPNGLVDGFNPNFTLEI